VRLVLPALLDEAAHRRAEAVLGIPFHEIRSVVRLRGLAGPTRGRSVDDSPASALITPTPGSSRRERRHRRATAASREKVAAPTARVARRGCRSVARKRLGAGRSAGRSAGLLAEHKALAGDLVQTGGPFPDRLHINELVFKFMWEQTETVIRWATWAEREVAGWPDNIARAEALEAGGFLRKAAGAPS
jgi:hypothetical protein